MPFTKSNKITIFAAVLIVFFSLLLGGHFVLRTKSGSASITQQVDYLLGKGKTVDTQNSNIDSDNDGLPDWQEKIYNTDPKNPDTDGDGYLDGEEVASGYDPTKKAPNDALAGTDTSKARPLPTNLTKALGMKLGESIATGKIKSFDANGQPLTTDELQQQAGLEEAITNATSQQLNDFVIPDISDYEIKISEKTGLDPANTYVIAMADAVGKIQKNSQTPSELELFAQAIESNDFSQLEANRQLYSAGYEKLKEVSVPQDLVSFHKNILGTLKVIGNIYAAVENINADPLKATIALMQYQTINNKTVDLILQLLTQLKNYK